MQSETAKYNAATILWMICSMHIAHIYAIINGIWFSEYQIINSAHSIQIIMFVISFNSNDAIK